MHKNAMKCNKTQSKWCINKHGASKIIDTFETYHKVAPMFIMFVANFSPFARRGCPLPSICSRKAHANVMAAAGSPLSNDKLVDYIITGLAKEYNAITTTLMLGNNYVPYDKFYSHILSFEALQEQQDQSVDWSLANVVSRPGFYSNPSCPRAPEYPAGAPR
jgi:hypothetical protein